MLTDIIIFNLATSESLLQAECFKKQFRASFGLLALHEELQESRIIEITVRIPMLHFISYMYWLLERNFITSSKTWLDMLQSLSLNDQLLWTNFIQKAVFKS